MATLNISMPGPMREWIDAQVSGGEYANASDYIRDLVLAHAAAAPMGSVCFPQTWSATAQDVADAMIDELLIFSVLPRCLPSFPFNAKSVVPKFVR